MGYYTDCYNINSNHIPGNHDDPNFVNIVHIDYIYFPSNPNNRVEVIIRDHDDINNPCFYILNEDRSKELYKVSLFDNKTVNGLSKEDKDTLNMFIREDYRELNDSNMTLHNIFNTIKIMWIGNNMDDYDETPYDNIIEPPYYE